VRQLPAVQGLPAGVRLIDVGDAEVMGELFASFGLAMLTGVLCIYIVLVLLFKDFLQPVTILAALPLSLGGPSWRCSSPARASMPSLIGLIMLMGIATKNSILLVEYAIVARRAHGRLHALLDACHKRARPIIMTTLAMGAGMMPIAVPGRGGHELSLAHGRGRDRRAHHLHRAEPAGRARGLHLRR
jgi:multidrug efflux pump subunit AcrB